MDIFLLGATGTIGQSVLQELQQNHHNITALARNTKSQEKLNALGVNVIQGDLRHPALWVNKAVQADAIIHVAATFTEDMGDVDAGVINALASVAENLRQTTKLIYTGGCWLYGETGDHIATETDELNPISAFSWMVKNYQIACNAKFLDTILIHPAMVYGRDGGALSRFLETGKKEGKVEVWGSPKVRWPVVHREDLAVAYRLAAETGKSGEIYNVSTQAGVVIGEIIDKITDDFKIEKQPYIRDVDDVVHEHGDWAVGPTLDQQMSSQKIRTTLGWSPKHTDILKLIGSS